MAQQAGDQVPGRVALRRAETIRTILDASWHLASTSGLEGLSLREIAAGVGMQAPSLYSYFPSKAAILDALFVDGYHAMDQRINSVLADLPPKADPRLRLCGLLRAWVEFCQEDQARYRLLFTNAMPGWAPSADAYTSSQRNYQLMCDYLALAGVVDPDDLDLCTALAAGLVAQQMANDPGGDRWSRRIDDVVDMLLRHVRSRARLLARTSRRNT
jgi:AcrR family transcriptional regulator